MNQVYLENYASFNSLYLANAVPSSSSLFAKAIPSSIESVIFPAKNPAPAFNTTMSLSGPFFPFKISIIILAFSLASPPAISFIFA